MVEKKCTKCKREFPATLEYFGKESKASDGLRSRCKECTKVDKAESYKKNIAHRKQYLAENREHILQYKKQYRDEHKEEISTYNKEYMPKYYQEHKEEMNESSRQNYLEHKSERNEYRKIQYQSNIDAEKERMKRYRLTTECNKQYYWSNREQCLSYNKEWRQRNKHTVRMYTQKRRQLIDSNTLSKEEWDNCLKHFGNRDAYTGTVMNIVSMDHIIPVTKGGTTTVDNIVPCDKSINSSKGNKDMEEWYRKQPFFSEERLNNIKEYIKLINRKDMV